MPRRRATLRLRSEIIGLKRDQKIARRDAGATVPSEDQQLDDNHPLAPVPLLPCAPSRHSSASAVAKLILCGEHAVVYGCPAIALPLAGIRARADVAESLPGSGIVVHARDLRRRWVVGNDPYGPISQLITSVLSYLQVPATATPDLRITVSSAIPIASGIGSGAAVATAIV